MSNEEGNKLIGDLTGLSRPLSKLVDAVSSGVGNLYEPTRIRREAKAKAEAQLILAEADIKTRELQRRADERVQHRELRRQMNIENITAKAAGELPEHVDEKRVDEDWVTQFFEQCQDVADDEMQLLWAKLLAGEVAQPGTYSRRTLNLVRLMSKDDAVLFTLFCRYVFKGDEFLLHIRTSKSDEYLRTKRFTYKDLLNLQNVGLVESGEVALLVHMNKPIKIYYFNDLLCLHTLPKSPNHSPKVSVTVLSKTGQELAPICGAKRDSKYIGILNEGLSEYGVGLNHPSAINHII